MRSGFLYSLKATCVVYVFRGVFAENVSGKHEQKKRQNEVFVRLCQVKDKRWNLFQVSIVHVSSISNAHDRFLNSNSPLECVLSISNTSKHLAAR